MGNFFYEHRGTSPGAALVITDEAVVGTLQAHSQPLLGKTHLSGVAGKIVGHPVQPLAGVLADVPVVPVNHNAKHITLDDFWISGDLEVRVWLSGPAGAALVALAVVP